MTRAPNHDAVWLRGYLLLPWRSSPRRWLHCGGDVRIRPGRSNRAS